MKVKMKLKIKYKAFYLKVSEQPRALVKPSAVIKPNTILVPVYNPFKVILQP